MRLDVILCELRLAKSREQAKSLINENKISVNGKIISKASYNAEKTDDIKIIGDVMPYVSRGGLKLEKAIKEFDINLCGKIAIDMGASTGGFTHCMLLNSIKKVYAIDVGCNQLAKEIKNNPKVINMENTNIRNMQGDEIGDIIDFISIDTSFISLTYILPVAFKFISEKGEIVALIKPQFEAGRENLGKNGIVKDKKVHTIVLNKIYNFVISCGFVPINIINSPITGGDGNLEFLMHIKKNGTPFDLNIKEQLGD